MRRLKRYICLVGLLALLAAALTGCGFSDDSVEELFTLPRMAEEYTGLTQELEALITQGYEYASPTGGRNIQSVQMADLDGDGQQEALAFFRMSSDEKPLKIFVFKIEGDSYARYCTIESSGTAIDSVYYQDLNGDGRRELIVGWRISAEVQTVAVYTVAREPVALMSSGYTRFTIQDLNGDGIPSLLVLRTDADSQPVAEFYGWQDEQMGVAYRCVLYSSMASLNRGSMVSGRVDADTPALFITGVDEQGMAVTALAGPASNFLLALLLLLIARLVYARALVTGALPETLFSSLVNTACLSVGLGLFNLVPVPPLDGSKVVAVLLPDRAYNWLMRYEQLGMVLLVVIISVGVGSNALNTAIDWVFGLFCRIVGF